MNWFQTKGKWRGTTTGQKGNTTLAQEHKGRRVSVQISSLTAHSWSLFQSWALLWLTSATQIWSGKFQCKTKMTLNSSKVLNYYHRVSFPCTEALCISSTRFRLLTVPQKSFSEESPIFKPADTLPISFKYKQKEGVFWVKQRWWYLVLFVRVHTPPPASQLPVTDTLQESIHTSRLSGPDSAPEVKQRLPACPSCFCNHLGPRCMGSTEMSLYQHPNLKTGLPVYAVSWHSLHSASFLPSLPGGWRPTKHKAGHVIENYST